MLPQIPEVDLTCIMDRRPTLKLGFNDTDIAELDLACNITRQSRAAFATTATRKETLRLLKEFSEKKEGGSNEPRSTNKC